MKSASKRIWQKKRIDAKRKAIANMREEARIHKWTHLQCHHCGKAISQLKGSEAGTYLFHTITISGFDKEGNNKPVVVGEIYFHLDCFAAVAGDEYTKALLDKSEKL